MKTQFSKIIPLLVKGNIRFILIGGVAGNVHGAARATYGVDIVYSRDPENLKRIINVLKPYSPYLRGAPPGMSFSWDEETIRNGLNFTLNTSLGDIDLWGEVMGGGTYKELVQHSEEISLYGAQFLCLGLERLIQIKRAAGRPKDLEAIAELQTILEERQRDNNLTE